MTEENSPLHEIKKERPYIDKLRIIQFIEFDFNVTMKMILGRPLMRHAKKLALIAHKHMEAAKIVVQMML